MQRITRRELLKTSASVASAAALTSFGGAVYAGSPNEDVRIAVIGLGGRGYAHANLFSKAKGAKVVALCDVDRPRLDAKAEEFAKETGTQVDRFTDYRKLLERDDIDAITIATPNHWHSLMTIHGLQAGKHVYCEKPVCHTVWEGRQMVNAAKNSELVTASGFQNRSDGGLIEAMGLIHGGEYGAIEQLRGLCYRFRNSIGKQESQLTPPKNLNYDLWLGPAADLPIMRPRLHYDWHWDFNTGNGDMGNQGPHEMDLLRWAMGEPLRHPTKIKSFGGRFAWDDAGNTPNTQCALLDYGNDIPVIFEVRNLFHKEKEKKHVGAFGKIGGPAIVVTCEKGEFRGGRGGGSFFDNDGKVVHKVQGGNDHYQNFVDAVRNNDRASVRSSLESAYYSSCMSHLANISVQVGRDVSDSEMAADLSGNALATECFERFSEQLDLWSVDREKTPWRLGSELTLDNASEQFVAGEKREEANALLRRKDRKPYVVPEIQAAVGVASS